MKNTFSKIRKFMAKNIKYTSLIYLNNTYCMNNNLNNTYCIKGKNCSYTDRGCIYNNNQQYLYHVNNTQQNINYLNNNNLQYQYYGNYSNSNSIQQNIGYSNYDNQQYTYYGNYSNPNFTQQNIGYSSYDNQQYQYYGNYSNPNFTQQNINYLNNNNPQYPYYGNYSNPNSIQQNINYLNNNNPQYPYYGNYSNPNSIQQNICHNGNSAFAPYIVNNNTNKKNTNVNNINDYNKAQIIDIKNKIIINRNEKNSQKEHINEEILQKEHRNNKKRKFNRIGRFRKENKKKCAEDFRKANLINRIFTASLRLVQCKANELLKKAKANELLENAKANELLENAKIKELSTNTKLKELFKNAKLKNKQFTKIHTFHEVPNKYKCIEELFSKNIEEILTKNSIRCKSKNHNAVIIEIINKLDDPNNENLKRLKEFLKINYKDFFNENINVETLINYDESFRIFYDVYKTDEENKGTIEDYINNFVDNVNSIKKRNIKKK